MNHDPDLADIIRALPAAAVFLLCLFAALVLTFVTYGGMHS